MKSIADCRLYSILDTAYMEHEVEFYAQAVLAGGADIVQLRAKHETPEQIANLAAKIHPITKAAGVPLIINDHPEVTYHIQCEGSHVGQDDISVAEARKLQGRSNRIVGKSTHSIEQAEAAQFELPDYIGFGPLFATGTKPDYAPIGLSEIADVHQKTQLPIFCIGGINLKTLPSVLEAGARRIVVVSAILTAPDPAEYCRALRRLLDATQLEK